MDLTIVGCGYVGLALAERLQPKRPQLRLTLTTTTSERLAQLSPLAFITEWQVRWQHSRSSSRTGCSHALNVLPHG